tara:strand:+ start:10682 stop:11143 length:462 start_codon:yes stop_codon:yes gene_type:complete
MGDYKEKNGTTRIGDFLRTVVDISPELLNLAGTVTGVSALSALGDRIKGADSLTSKDKDIALAMLEMDMADAKEITKRWESDNLSDSFLSKNVRPMALIFLTISMAVYIVVDSANDNFVVKNEWIDLLSSLLLLIYAAYFGGRSLEKIQKMRK